MPIKNILQRFQPTQLYIILVLSICYFSVQLVLSHFTHALTLLMASYHMLCNIFALAGCIITIKHSKRKTETNEKSHLSLSEGSSLSKNDQEKTVVISLNGTDQTIEKQERRAMKLRNTFGWTRIDILTMLIVCIILASLSFSLLVEALQTLVHIDHQDTMHLPIPVLILGFVGLVLNGLTYFLIGGYTMHQGSFLHLTPSGNVVLDRAMSNSGELALKADERQLSKTKNDHNLKEVLEKEIGQVHVTPKRQGAVEMLRDISSTLFVIVCAIIVYMAEDEEHTAKFIDPILSIFSCVFLVSLSYPYMKESCLILLQTIPGCINMENFERNLVAKFPEIVNYHDLHIWQLSAQRYVATIHIKFKNPTLYTKIIDDVRNYFHEQGITEVTIQPEFHAAKSTPSLECLVQCNAPECLEKVCCKDSRSDLREISVGDACNKSNSKSSLESLKMSKEIKSLKALSPSIDEISPTSMTANDKDEINVVAISKDVLNEEPPEILKVIEVEMKETNLLTETKDCLEGNNHEELKSTEETVEEQMAATEIEVESKSEISADLEQSSRTNEILTKPTSKGDSEVNSESIPKTTQNLEENTEPPKV